MSKLAPPGDPHSPPAQPTTNPDEELVLTPGAFEMLDLGPPGDAPPTRGQAAGAASQAPPKLQDGDDQDIIPSELIAPATPLHSGGAPQSTPLAARPGNRAIRGAGGAVLVLLLAVWGWQTWHPQTEVAATVTRNDGDGVAPKARPAGALPQVALGGPTQARPLPAPGPELLPLTGAGPKAKITPLTQETVDALDWASLRAAPAPAQGAHAGAAYDLWAWAQFRLALVYGDPAAHAVLVALGQATPSADALGAAKERTGGHRHRPALVHRPNGRHRHTKSEAAVPSATDSGGLRPLQAAVWAGAALLVQPPPQATQTLHILAPALGATPQGRLVLALHASPLAGAGTSVDAQARLTELVGARPPMPDAQLALAIAKLDTGDTAAGEALLQALAMQNNPDTWAQACHVLWQRQRVAALGHLMDRRLKAYSSQTLAQDLAQAAPAHQTLLRRLIMRHRMSRGDIPGALAWAAAQVAAQPQGLASNWDYLRLAQFAGTAAPAAAMAVVTAPDSAQAEAAAAALVTAGQRVNVAAWREAGLALARDRNDAALPALAQALQAAAAGDRHNAQAALAQMPKADASGATAALTAALAADLAHDDPGERQRALAGLQQRSARLDDELIRPEAGERIARLLAAAEDAGTPQARSSAALNLLWQDPLTTDPIRLIVQWAVAVDADAPEKGRSAAAAELEGLARLDVLIAQRPVDDSLVEAAMQVALLRAPRRLPGYAQTLLLRHPGDAGRIAALAEAYLAAGDRPAAQALLAPLMRSGGTGSQDANLLYAQARTWMPGDAAKARTLLVAATLAAPQARAYGALAELALGRGLLDEAQTDLEHAIALQPHEPLWQLRQARIFLSQKNAIKADAVATHLLTWNLPASLASQAWEISGLSRRELGRAPEAAQAFERAIALDPGRKDLLLSLARMELQELGQSRKALARLASLTQQVPEDGPPFYFYGMALREAGRNSEAKEAYRHYLRVAPEGEFATDARDTLADLSR